MLPQKPSGAHNRAGLGFRRPFYQAAMTPSPGGSVQRPLMSALGHKRTSKRLCSMSVFTPKKLDIVQHGGNVRFVP